MRKLEEFPDLIFYRPAAFILVKAISRTKIRPDHISVTAIIFGIAAGYFYSIGSSRSIVVAAVLYLFFNILDCSDGMLARLTNKGTLVGRIIDGLSDYIATVAVYIGLAIGFALKAERSFFWFTMLVFTGISTCVHSITVDYYRNRFTDYMTNGCQFRNDIEKFRIEYNALGHKKGEWIQKLILFIYLKYSQVQSSLFNEANKVQFIATPEEYYERNKRIIRFWVLLGPSMEITLLIIFSLINRIDIFIWIIIILFNFLAAALWITQTYIDNTFKKTRAE